MDAGSTPHTKPAIFEALPFAEAAALTERDQRLLVVDATASWCMPCQIMDRSTWVDAKLVEWLEQHARAIQIDVDQQSDVARRRNIRSMPTVIAFQRGKELDRIVGARGPAELIEWLEGVLREERNADRIRAQVTSTEAQTGKKDIRGRLDLASALLLSGELSAATQEYCWLWNHMLEHDEAFIGVRLSFMTFDMTALAESFQPAREAFTALREQTAVRLSSAAPRATDRVDWIVLNRVLDDNDRTLVWFEQARTDPSALRLSAAAVHELEELLLSRRRWSDVAIFYPDPIASLQEQAGMLTMDVPNIPDLPEQPDFHAIHLRMFSDFTARLYAALLAAGRDDEARSVAEEARRLEPSP